MSTTLTPPRPPEAEPNPTVEAPSAGRGPMAAHPALWLFPVPALVLYVAFFVIPTIQGVVYSVTDWDGFSPTAEFVGLDNFVTIFTNDDLFRNALGNNLKFMLVVVIFQTIFSLVLAVFLTKNSKSSVALRSIFFFPTILSSVSVAFIWKFVYDPNFGLINSVLDYVGLDQFQSAFLGNDSQAIYWVAITQVWFHVGQMMIIYIAGLQQIPQELYESAQTDGASRWQQFRHITLPMVAPATAIVMAYTTVQSFKAFDLILGLGGNPPKGSLDILSTRIYSGFANSQFGYAAAESLVFMALIAAITWIQRRAVKASNPDA
ncbi:carbohydrate ABC transporter permease [Humibacillus xanthopallidus]|uniref:carbohydrate ABC transporter permease n=1 Tax=Humibacillus xanthopallidus TaxID=412689 RepID=UPI00384EDC17